MNQKMIPFLFILRIFWPTIPEKRPKTVEESELLFFWNRNRHSPNAHNRNRLVAPQLKAGRQWTGIKIGRIIAKRERRRPARLTKFFR